MRKFFSISFALVSASFIALFSPVVQAKLVPMSIQPYDTVYRFYNASTGKHMMTQDYNEALHVDLNNPAWTYEGAVFSTFAYLDNACEDNSVEVYRFWNGTAFSHVYAMGEEVSSIELNPAWTKESVVFCAAESDAQDDNLIPVYRFYNHSTTSHVYTISAEEKALIENNSAFVAEGIAFQVREREISEEEAYLYAITNSVTDSDKEYLNELVSGQFIVENIEDFNTYAENMIQIFDLMVDRIEALPAPSGSEDLRNAFVTPLNSASEYIAEIKALINNTEISEEDLIAEADVIVQKYGNLIARQSSDLNAAVREYAQVNNIVLPYY